MKLLEQFFLRALFSVRRGCCSLHQAIPHPDPVAILGVISAIIIQDDIDLYQS